MLSPERKGRITASSAGAILGHDPWRTADDVMRAMVREWHGAEPEFTGNAATVWGQANEAGAIAEFTMETGLTVEPAEFVCNDWLGATPDGLVSDGGLIEVKCPYGLRNGGAFKSIFHELPHYYDQIQVQLFVTSATHCHFFQWSQHGTKHQVVGCDVVWLGENLDKLKRFHEDYIYEREKSFKRHLEPKRPIIETAEARLLVAEYDEVVETLERYEERKKELIDRFAAMSKGKNSEICGRLFTEVERAGSVSYAKVVKEHCPDVDLEQYRGKPTKYWKFT